MKDLTQILAVSTLSIGLVWGAVAQDVKSDDLTKNQKTESQRLLLKNQNQNQGDIQNREQNRLIHGSNFIDNNGDGYNDNAPDHDKDGIPNGQDSDYTGSGKGKRHQTFDDQNTDGIADKVGLRTRNGFRAGIKNKNGYGPKDGSGNKGVQPQDGSGFGPGANSGKCDGSGPRGKNMRGSQSR